MCLWRPRVRSLHLHYRSRRPNKADLEARGKEICATRGRYGYRRVHVLLRGEGWDVNIKKTHRIYNELGLQLGNRTPKRRLKAKLRDEGADASERDLGDGLRA
jgi:putative transposase